MTLINIIFMIRINKFFSFLILTSLCIANGSVFSSEVCNKIKIPLKLDKFNIPYLTLIINKREYKALFDLGSSYSIHIPKKDIKDFPQLKYTGDVEKTININGEINNNMVFFIPNLSIECMSFENINGIDFQPWDVSIGPEVENEKLHEIVIGRGLFKDKLITIDYIGKNLIVEDYKNKFEIRDLFFFPFKDEKEGITISLKSKYKNYFMSLDTGASESIFVSSKVDPKENIEHCDFDLGPKIDCEKIAYDFSIVSDNDFSFEGAGNFKSESILYPIDKRFKMDGLLGSDFFLTFIVKINFPLGSMSLKKPKKEITLLKH